MGLFARYSRLLCWLLGDFYCLFLKGVVLRSSIIVGVLGVCLVFVYKWEGGFREWFIVGLVCGCGGGVISVGVCCVCLCYGVPIVLNSSVTYWLLWLLN